MSIIWTGTEDYLLAKHWPTGGVDKCRAVLPRRTDRAIKTRAYLKGLRITDNRLSTARKPWTDEEMQFLRDNYPRHGIEHCVNAMPYRTATSIRIKVAMMGLRLDDDTLSEIRANQITIRRKPRQAATAPIVENTTASKALAMRW